MSAWLLIACASAFLIKLSGYTLPESVLDREWVPELSAWLTVGLLASLTVLNTVNSAHGLAWDSRLLALGAAMIALRLKAPYLLVVLVGAAAAALGRAAGLP